MSVLAGLLVVRVFSVSLEVMVSQYEQSIEASSSHVLRVKETLEEFACSRRAYSPEEGWGIEVGNSSMRWHHAAP